MKISLLFLSFAIFFFCPVAESAQADFPRVVVSIKPIHSLVAGVMQDVADPHLLIKGGGSPHGYVMRPSEVQAIASADLIIWVGHQLESFLEKPLTTLGQGAIRLELMDQLEASLLPVRAGGNWGPHRHSDEFDHHHSHEEVSYDPHFWLSPQLAKQVVEQTASRLVVIDPARAEKYRLNAEVMMNKLDQLEVSIKQRLALVQDVPYVVFHDAYHYFEAAFDMNAVGSITIDPERRPGVRRLLEMRNKLKELGARAVFSEPQFEPKLVATIVEGTDARRGELDPLGAELPAGAESYFQLMNTLADSLLEGLN